MDIKAELQEIFRDVFDNDDLILREDMNADDVGEWDSLSQILLVAKAEKTFGIKFTISEANSLELVGDYIKLIEEKMSLK